MGCADGRDVGVYGNVDIFYGIANCLGLARRNGLPGMQKGVNDH